MKFIVSAFQSPKYIIVSPGNELITEMVFPVARIRFPGCETSVTCTTLAPDRHPLGTELDRSATGRGGHERYGLSGDKFF